MSRTTKVVAKALKRAASTNKPATVADLRRITDRQTAHLLAALSSGSAPVEPVKQPKYSGLAIGSVLPGGIFAGITYVDAKPYVLVLGPEYDGECAWPDFQTWLKTLSIDGCADFVCPSKLDGMVLWANLRKEFKPVYYWLEQHAEGSSRAWYQHFGSGTQAHWDESGRSRCRAVRRFPSAI